MIIKGYSDHSLFSAIINKIDENIDTDQVTIEILDNSINLESNNQVNLSYFLIFTK